MGYVQHNSVGKLSYEKTDGSSVFLNRFARTVFTHFPVSPLKKICNRGKRTPNKPLLAALDLT